jgi:hypothetical protein
MPKPRTVDAAKKLAGTLRTNRAEASLFHGRHRLENELPPPSDLDPDAQRGCRVLMRLVIEAGTINATNLHCFPSMAQAAAATRKAYAAAMKTGPTPMTKEGEDQPGLDGLGATIAEGVHG